jgi:hypothetical protein
VTAVRAGALAIASLVALGAGAPNGENVLAQEPPELVAQLREQGMLVMEDVASSDPQSFVVAWVIFTQPRERAVALVTDGSRQREWRPGIDGVETVERNGTARVDEVRMRVMFRELVYRVKYQRDEETQRITWSLDPRFDNDLETFDGFWEFYALADGRTLGRFGTRVDAGMVLPAAMQRSLTRRNVVDTMKACKRWVDSDGRWRP